MGIGSGGGVDARTCGGGNVERASEARAETRTRSRTRGRGRGVRDGARWTEEQRWISKRRVGSCVASDDGLVALGDVAEERHAGAILDVFPADAAGRVGRDLAE